MPAVKPKYSNEELAKMGEAVFEKHVRPLIQNQNKNHVVAIDIESGAYEIDAQEQRACERLRIRFPDAQIWLRRVGSRYLRHFGGRAASEEP